MFVRNNRRSDLLSWTQPTYRGANNYQTLRDANSFWDFFEPASTRTECFQSRGGFVASGVSANSFRPDNMYRSIRQCSTHHHTGERNDGQGRDATRKMPTLSVTRVFYYQWPDDAFGRFISYVEIFRRYAPTLAGPPLAFPLYWATDVWEIRNFSSQFTVRTRSPFSIIPRTYRADRVCIVTSLLLCCRPIDKTFDFRKIPRAFNEI